MVFGPLGSLIFGFSLRRESKNHLVVSCTCPFFVDFGSQREAPNPSKNDDLIFKLGHVGSCWLYVGPSWTHFWVMLLMMVLCLAMLGILQLLRMVAERLEGVLETQRPPKCNRQVVVKSNPGTLPLQTSPYIKKALYNVPHRKGASRQLPASGQARFFTTSSPNPSPLLTQNITEIQRPSQKRLLSSATLPPGTIVEY